MIQIDNITLTQGECPEITGHLVNNEWADCSSGVISVGTVLTETGLNGKINVSDYTDLGYHGCNSITIEENCHGNMTVFGDLKVTGKIKTGNSEINKIDLDEDDIILLTVDPEQYDLDTCQSIFEVWQKSFPNHKIVMTLKGVKIDFIKEKRNKENEVSW